MRRVFVATPSLNSTHAADYTYSLLATDRLCREHGVELLPGGAVFMSDIVEARTLTFNQALRNDPDDIFWIDSDGAWRPEDFLAVLLVPEDMVAGAVPKKTPHEDYAVVLETDIHGQLIQNDSGFLALARIGFAFLRMSRAAIRTMIRVHWRDRIPLPGGDFQYRFFDRVPNPAGIGPPLSEDFSFCHRFKQTGGQIWLKPDCDFSHFGIQEWKGNYHTFLRKCPGGDLEGS